MAVVIREMQPLPFTKRELQGQNSMRIAIDMKSFGRDLAVYVGCGTFLALIDPYGANSTATVWIAWLYWTGLVIYGSFAGRFVTQWFEKSFPNAALWVLWLVVSMITALLVTPVVIGIGVLSGAQTSWKYFPINYAFVWVISAALTGVGILVDRAFGDQSHQAALAESDPLERFMEKLPVPYRSAELYAISSEDHYIRVHTSAGEHLFLERLSDAIHDLKGAKGLQTHRSWWVSETGVKSAETQKGRIVLTLKSDTTAPVSRTYAKAVREAGWV